MGVAFTTWEVMDERSEMLRLLLDVLDDVGSEHALIGGLAVRLSATDAVGGLFWAPWRGRLPWTECATTSDPRRHSPVID